MINPGKLGGIHVRKEVLDTDQKKLEMLKKQDLAQTPPSKAGAGETIDQLEKIVENVQTIYNKILLLADACSKMLNETGYQFNLADEEAARLIVKREIGDYILIS